MNKVRRLDSCVSGWDGPLFCRGKSRGKESPEQRHIRDLGSPLQEPPVLPREDSLGNREESLVRVSMPTSSQAGHGVFKSLNFSDPHRDPKSTEFLLQKPCEQSAGGAQPWVAFYSLESSGLGSHGSLS